MVMLLTKILFGWLDLFVRDVMQLYFISVVYYI